MKLSRYLASAALLAAVGACTSGDATGENPGAMGTEVGSEGDRCAATVCFPFQLEKDVSFVAVRAEDCAGALRTIEVFELHADGTRVPLEREQTTVGQGHSCGGVLAPGDVKIEGIHTPNVEVCVNHLGVGSPGEVTVYAKAADGCFESETFHGTCAACDGTEHECGATPCDGSCGATPCDGSCGATPCDGSCGATPCDGSCGEGTCGHADHEAEPKKEKKSKKDKKPKKEKKHDHDGDGHEDHDEDECPEDEDEDD